jgi:hypothetical protein
MSGLQDENSFSAGGGTEGGEQQKQVAQVSRPDPAAVRAAVEQQIAAAKQSAAATKPVRTFLPTGTGRLRRASGTLRGRSAFPTGTKTSGMTAVTTTHRCA